MLRRVSSDRGGRGGVESRVGRWLERWAKAGLLGNSNNDLTPPDTGVGHPVEVTVNPTVRVSDTPVEVAVPRGAHGGRAVDLRSVGPNGNAVDGGHGKFSPAFSLIYSNPYSISPPFPDLATSRTKSKYAKQVA